jgi:sugar lactone lactonase YvrE
MFKRSLLATIVLLVGCYSVDYPATYRCSGNAGAEAARCPAGYECDGKECVKKGTVSDGALPDGSPADGPPATPDQGKVIRVTTLAGDGQNGFKNGNVLQARFSAPNGFAVDKSGRILVADTGNHCIRLIDQGTVSTFAGACANGLLKGGYVDGPAAVAKFNGPSELVFDAAGKLYVADWGNHCVRAVSGGTVTTVAGICGTLQFGHVDGSAANAKFHYPTSLAIDGSGRLLVADASNHCIRAVDLTKNEVSSVAGTCTKKGFKDGAAAEAKFNTPVGLAIGPKGGLFISEWGNGDAGGGQRIRRLDGGQVSTFAGSGQAGFADGPAAVAAFNDPFGLVFGTNAELFVSDSKNHRIRVVAQGQVVTLAGAGIAGHKDDVALKAAFNAPKGLAGLPGGKLLVADSGNHRIRLVGEEQ